MSEWTIVELPKRKNSTEERLLISSTEGNICSLDVAGRQHGKEREHANKIIGAPGALDLLKKALPIVSNEALNFHPASQRYRDMSALADDITKQIDKMEGRL